MADAHKYQAHEVLNRVLNTAETAIQVDIVSGSEYAEDAAHTTADVGTFVLAVRNDTLAYLGADGDYVPFQVNADGALYVDVADGGQLDTIIDTLETTLTAIETDQAAIEVLLTAANVDHAANEVLLGTIDSDTDAIKTAVEKIDDSIFADNAGFTLTTSSVNVAGGVYQSGTPGTLADNDAGAVLLNSTAGQMVELMASTATTEVVGDAAEDDAVAGNPVLTGGRYDATQRTLDDGDAGALALDPSGALYTREYTGQYGAVYTTASSDVIVPPTGKAFVAVQMLEDTTFDSSGGLIPVSENVWFGTEHAAGDLGSGSETTAEGSGGKQIDNSVTFPQGMTIFGRWSGIDVNGGSVIAYIGDY